MKSRKCRHADASRQILVHLPRNHDSIPSRGDVRNPSGPNAAAMLSDIGAFSRVEWGLVDAYSRLDVRLGVYSGSGFAAVIFTKHFEDRTFGARPL